jgi:hypothetical protein
MATTAVTPKRRGRAPSPWWKRILPSAAVIAAIVTAGPLWLDQLYRWWDNIPQPIEQRPEEFGTLWVKNFACTSAPATWLTRAPNIRIASTVCDSGDVFVHAATPGHDYFSWLTLDNIMKSSAGGGGLIAAQAATLPPGMTVLAQGTTPPLPPPNVICHRFIDKRYLLRRLQTPQGCVDETIDMFQGIVVSKKAAPCMPQC